MKAQWRTVVQRAILLALAVAASDVAAQPKPALQIRPGMMEKGPPVLQNQPAAAVTAPLRLKQNVTLQQLLTMPDTTVVQSPDGRQTATVGDLRRRVQAQRQVLAAIQSGKYLTGGRASVRSARGLSTVNNLRVAVTQETALAQSLRSTRVTGAVSSHLQGAVGTRLSAVPQPGIDTVNGKVSGFIVSPGGYLTIGGRGFGDTIGQVNIIGALFPGGGVSLRVVDWRAEQIYAIVPPEIRGVPDLAVNLQVITRDAKTFRIDGGKFYAAREEIVVRTNIPRMVRLRPWNPWPPNPMTNEGYVGRVIRGESITCRSPGMDALDTVDPGRGFVVTGLNATWGRTDSGDRDLEGYAGSRTFFPGYGFGEWYGDSINVRWGVWRSHTSPDGNDWLVASAGWDHCASDYQIEVVLSGPVGVAPF